MVDEAIEQRVQAIRRFNRFYTRQIGLLREGYLESPFSLTEVRVLYELAHLETTTARDLAMELGLDAGYLSRILGRFKQRGLITKETSPVDARQNLVRLTEQGQDAFTPLDQRSREDIGAMVRTLSPAEQTGLIAAMQTIESLLGLGPEPKVPYLLRPHRPGDMGWVAHRHGAIYADEYGWDERFEALVARIAADFIEYYDPTCERCWIAERDGENVGSVFLVRHPDQAEVAKLRLLLVEPTARGLGIGQRLVAECLRFARQAGYHTVTLWTNSVLISARRIYEAAGFRLVHEAPHHSFGHDLVGQTWELEL